MNEGRTGRVDGGLLGMLIILCLLIVILVAGLGIIITNKVNEGGVSGEVEEQEEVELRIDDVEVIENENSDDEVEEAPPVEEGVEGVG